MVDEVDNVFEYLVGKDKEMLLVVVSEFGKLEQVLQHQDEVDIELVVDGVVQGQLVVQVVILLDYHIQYPEGVDLQVRVLQQGLDLVSQVVTYDYLLLVHQLGLQLGFGASHSLTQLVVYQLSESQLPVCLRLQLYQTL